MVLYLNCLNLIYRLYKSIRDYDSVSGIFAFKLNTREVTRLALKAETLGDFSTALKHYEKVMHFLLLNVKCRFILLYN